MRIQYDVGSFFIGLFYGMGSHDMKITIQTTTIFGFAIFESRFPLAFSGRKIQPSPPTMKNHVFLFASWIRR